MKTNKLILAVLMLGLIASSCNKTTDLNTSAGQVSLKSALTNGVQDLTTAVNAITSSVSYQVVAGPADLTTKSFLLSFFYTVTHSILLADIAGVYDYKATQVSHGHGSILRFFNKTAESAQMVVRMPEEKVKASKKLLHYTPSDTSLINNYVVTLSDYQYRFKYFNGWTYQMASGIKIKDVDAGVLKIQTSNDKTSGYHFASEFNFPNGYTTKCSYSSGDTAVSVYAISNGTKTLYQEKYTAIKTSSEIKHREKEFSLTIGNVLIVRKLDHTQTSLDSAKVYVDGVLQLKSKVEIVDKTTDTTDKCITGQKRELKITFDDGTTATFTELANNTITDISTLFASMRQANFATAIIDWMAWDVYTKK
jgi:hypothetical protein